MAGSTTGNPAAAIPVRLVTADGTAFYDANEQGGETGAFINITTATTTLVKSGAGVLQTVLVGTLVASATLTLYNSLTGAGAKIATLTLPSTITGDAPIALALNVPFTVGLTVVTSGATDVTVVFQ
jgi:hypothetical protein